MRYAKPFSTSQVIAQQPTQVNGAVIAAPLVIQASAFVTNTLVRAAAIICCVLSHTLTSEFGSESEYDKLTAVNWAQVFWGGGTKVVYNKDKCL